MSKDAALNKKELSFDEFKKDVLNDYRIAMESREASYMGRREVLTGKAKFGIFGDGKEIAQLAMAKQFREGDFRSGYYRDQTFMFATGNLTLQQWFAGLYGHANLDADPTSAGRQMGGHFATRSLDEYGEWKNLMKIKNSSSDISPTGGQMPRLLGLAQASKVYRNHGGLNHFTTFSDGGNEVAFGTIGDASTSEGIFWETINAAGVLKVPMAISIWDDGHGISVPKKYQTTKESISEALSGMQRKDKDSSGYEIFKSKGWDYPHLCETYEKAIQLCRTEHVPVMIHVEEVTQPQGHSTSGSHERYKNKERLQWESDFDGIKKMREWMIQSAIATNEELDAIENNAKAAVRDAKKAAWDTYQNEIKKERAEAIELLRAIAGESGVDEINVSANNLQQIAEPIRKDSLTALRKALMLSLGTQAESRIQIENWLAQNRAENEDRYNSYLHSRSDKSALHIEEVLPKYHEDARVVDAREILRDNFDTILTYKPEVLIFGEDVGGIGDVNQGCEKLQEKFGELRVSDTGIREATIIGQGIGMALRGLRPIAEIQYLDYLLYAIQILSDDLSTLQYRTKGGQKAPLIVRTRGHRLEGVWHSGSPMGMIINSLRGMYVCVPRNMTKAAGFYNTLLASDEPALVIEPLNGYRLKERLPVNMGAFKTPLGIPEVMEEGSDVTLVTYGSCVRVAQEATALLREAGISVELIDVQTLLPFDLNHSIVESLKKTNRILFLDEDVPGGATAYMMQQVLEIQNGYLHLDAAPRTLTAMAHRPAYGSDGDYFSKPGVEDVFDAVYSLVKE